MGDLEKTFGIEVVDATPAVAAQHGAFGGGDASTQRDVVDQGHQLIAIFAIVGDGESVLAIGIDMQRFYQGFAVVGGDGSQPLGDGGVTQISRFHRFDFLIRFNGGQFGNDGVEIMH
ncbi:hypothetical protein D3C80_18730 [compost metagenome]